MKTEGKLSKSYKLEGQTNVRHYALDISLEAARVTSFMFDYFHNVDNSGLLINFLQTHSSLKMQRKEKLRNMTKRYIANNVSNTHNMDDNTIVIACSEHIMTIQLTKKLIGKDKWDTKLDKKLLTVRIDERLPRRRLPPFPSIWYYAISQVIK